MLMYPIAACYLPAKSKKVGSTDIYLAIPSGYVATILGVYSPFPREPLVFLRMLKPAYSCEFSLLWEPH